MPSKTTSQSSGASARKRIGWSLLGALFAEVVNKAAPLLVLYFAQSRLGAAGFGQVQYALAFCELLIPFVAFGYNGLAAIEIGQKKDSAAALETATATLVLKGIHLILVSTFGALFVLSVPTGTPFAVYAAAALLLLASCLDTDFVHLGTQTMLARNLIVVVAKALGVVGVIVFVRDPADVVLYAGLAAFPTLAVSVFSGLYNLRRIAPRWPRSERMRSLFLQSIPMAFYTFIYTLADRFDVLLVGRLFDAELTGIYSGQMRLVQSVLTAASSIGLIFFSEMVSCPDRETFSRRAYFSLWAMFALVGPIAGGIWFVDEWVLTLMYAPAFAAHAAVLDILITGTLLHVLIQVLGSQVLFIRRRIWTFNAIIGGSVLCGCLVSLALYATYGITGVALGNLASKIISALLLYFVARPYLEPFPWGDMARVLAPAAIMAAALWLGDLDTLWGTIAAGACVYGAAFVLLNNSRLRHLLRRREN